MRNFISFFSVLNQDVERERERENHLIACLSSLWDKFEGQAVIVYYFDLALYYKSFINKSVMNAMYLKVSHFQSGVYEWEAWCLPTPTRKRKFLLSYRTVTIKLLLLACFKYSICAAICHYTLYHFICSLESFIYCNNFFFLEIIDINTFLHRIYKIHRYISKSCT